MFHWMGDISLHFTSSTQKSFETRAAGAQNVNMRPEMSLGLLDFRVDN